MISNVLFSSKSDEWSTPQTLFDTLNEEFHFTLDPCATDENAKCKMYYTISENGLEKTWTGYCVFCNPPYSQIQKWVKKCAEEARKGATVVMLIPARTDTRWFHDYIYKKADIRFIKGRLRFSDSKNTAPFPSMIVIWNGGMADLISRQAAIDAEDKPYAADDGSPV